MRELSNRHRVMVLGPHTDDGEFGSGATIAEYVENGVDLFYVMFSICEDSVPDGLPKDILKKEAIASSKILGIKEENLIFFDFPVRKFPHYRQEILEEMVRLRKEVKPDLVLLSSNSDLHQDLRTIANEGWRPFKETSILGYEVSWNNLSFTTHLFSLITEEHLQKKIAALKAYTSQHFRSYTKDSFIRSLAEVRGTQVNQPLAEAFEVIRWIM